MEPCKLKALSMESGSSSAVEVHPLRDLVQASRAASGTVIKRQQILLQGTHMVAALHVLCRAVQALYRFVAG